MSGRFWEANNRSIPAVRTLVESPFSSVAEAVEHAAAGTKKELAIENKVSTYILSTPR
jgi:hypothetical protein